MTEVIACVLPAFEFFVARVQTEMSFVSTTCFSCCTTFFFAVMLFTTLQGVAQFETSKLGVNEFSFRSIDSFFYCFCIVLHKTRNISLRFSAFAFLRDWFFALFARSQMTNLDALMLAARKVLIT